MYKIVVIDDERIVVRGIEAIIKRENLQCEVVGAAYDGIEGLQVLEATRPDIVITDIRIPKIDGLLLIEKAKVLLPNAYFIVISGFKEFEYAKRALAMGVKSYIEKPVTIEKIKEALSKIENEELIKKAHMLAENQSLRGKELDHYLDSLMQSIIDVDVNRLKRLLEEYMLTIRTYFPFINHFRRECLQMLCVLCEFYAEKEKSENWSSGISFDAIKSMDSHSEVEAYVREILNKIMGNMETQNHHANRRDIKRLLEYIGCHYDQDIGLTELAEQVNLNTSYLSILFKEEVGTTYVKYLTSLRIKKAKELLLEDYKVTQVSKMVGYNNYRHFCDIFKKCVGQSPNEYKGCLRSKIPIEMVK